MILDARAGVRGTLTDADTGRVIRHVRRADLETGEYEAFRAGPDGKILRDGSGQPISYRARARLRFTPAAPLSPSPYRAAPSTPFEEIRKEVLKGRTVEPVLALAGRECEEPKCHRLATWKSATEQVVEPETVPDGRRYERGVIVKVQFWCDRHYRPLVSISERGVESEVEVAARPQ